jgi:hypothetical protein
MPDITVPPGLARLQEEASRRCQKPLRDEDRARSSNLAEGTILGQYPAIETPIDCGTEIGLIRSVSPPTSRPPLPPPSSPPPPPPPPSPGFLAWIEASPRWWLLGVAILIYGIAARAFRFWPFHAVPPARIEAGVPLASASTAHDGFGLDTPVIALEALGAGVALTFPEGIPIVSVETDRG